MTTGYAPAYRIAAAIAALTAILSIWRMIARDDGTGAGYLLIVMAALVCAITAGFEASRMSRAMAGIAALQVANAALIATAPTILSMPGAASRAVMAGAILTLLWLCSAACFARAARTDDLSHR